MKDNVLQRHQNTNGNVLFDGATISESDSHSSKQIPVVDVYGYTWGTDKMYLPNHYGKPAPRQPEAFDRIIIADCLWMASQHANLVKTILRYLDPSRPDSCALVVAGFHTGRGIVRHFFEVATGEWTDEDQEPEKGAQDQEPELVEVQGRLKAAEIFEIDVNGTRRPWQPVREGENKDQTKRWCVCAVLVRR